jgi:signal transduction histidine kinase
VAVAPGLRLGHVPWLLLPAAGAGAALAAILAAPRSATGLTAYGQASGTAAAADLAAGIGLVAAGLVAWVVRPGGRLGAAAMLAGIAWFAADWEGWEGGPPLIRSLGLAVAPFALALPLALVLAGGGRAASRAALALVAVAAVVGAGRALVHDPFLDPYCWRNCTDNVFLVRAEPGIARVLDAVWLRLALVAGVVVAAGAAWRLVKGARLVPLLLPGVLVGAGAAVYAVALLDNPAERPDDPVFVAVFLARCGATLALAAGLTWTVFATLRTRRAVARLAAQLGEAPPPGSLRAALARAAADPGLEVAYWLPATRRYVDAAGRPVDPPRAGGGRAVTPLVRAGRQVAVVAHDAGALDLVRTIGPAARLAVDNERLQAESLAQLHDLRASRGRIVETGDAERRRLERNLHDGAQQRLLALSYDLRLARSSALADDDAELAAVLATAGEQAQLALDELRELAHGIYPTILTEAGLGPALLTLADDAPLPVEIDAVAEERYPEAVESAAYRTIVEAVQDAAHSGASHARVQIAPKDDRLVLEVHDDGAHRTSAMQPIADRVGALGGRVDVEPTLIRAEIPCA